MFDEALPVFPCSLDGCRPALRHAVASAGLADADGQVHRAVRPGRRRRHRRAAVRGTAAENLGPAGGDREPAGGDSIVAINAFLSANDDHVFLFGPAGNFAVHPFVYSKLSYDPKDLNPIARASNTILAVAVKADAPYNDIKGFTEAARKAPGTFNSGLVQGITEFTFWGYSHVEKLQITQVPYRDINVAPVDPSEGRIQVVMSSLAIVQPQTQAGRIKLIAVNNKTRAPAAPDIRTAREQGFPSLEVEGLVGLFGLKTTPAALKDKIAADFKAAAEDGAIAERLKQTGQVINVGGPKEFADAIAEQQANVAAVVKAIDFKPKQ